MNTLAPTFLIGFSSFLQVTRTVIRSRMISKFGEVEPWTAELAALERLKKKPIDLQWERCCGHSSVFISYSCREQGQP